MITPLVFRILLYAGTSLIEVMINKTEDEARAVVADWENDEIKRLCTCFPALPDVEGDDERMQDNRVLPTPMSLFSFETTIGEILIASDDEVSARLYAQLTVEEYARITGKSVTLAEPNNVAPVHAVFLSGQSLTDYLDPAELAEFDYPNSTDAVSGSLNDDFKQDVDSL